MATKGERAKLPKLCGIPDVCEATGFVDKTIRRMVDAGTIPGVIRIGRSIRFKEDAIAEWIRNGCKPGRLERRDRPQWRSLGRRKKPRSISAMPSLRRGSSN